MYDDEPRFFEAVVSRMAKRQGLVLTRNSDGSYSLMSAGDIPRTIAGVETLEQAYEYLTDPDRFER